MARVNVQKVFRKVIEAGYYNNDPSSAIGNAHNYPNFMCPSLGYAARVGKITWEELERASAAIERELRGSSTLRIHLNRILEDCQFIRPSQFQREKIGIRIYWNWYDRKRIYARLQKKYSKETGE